MPVSKKFKHDLVRDTVRRLLRLDADDVDRELLEHLLNDGHCPTDLPELGIKDCPTLESLGSGVRPEKKCWACWMVALHDPEMDDER